MNTAVKIKSCTRASASGKIAYNEERTKNKKQDILLLEKNEMPKEVSLSKENKKEIKSLQTKLSTYKKRLEKAIKDGKEKSIKTNQKNIDKISKQLSEFKKSDSREKYFTEFTIALTNSKVGDYSENWSKKTLEHIKQEFPMLQVISAVEHKDQHSPHMHILLHSKDKPITQVLAEHIGQKNTKREAMKEAYSQIAHNFHSFANLKIAHKELEPLQKGRKYVSLGQYKQKGNFEAKKALKRKYGSLSHLNSLKDELEEDIIYLEREFLNSQPSTSFSLVYKPKSFLFREYNFIQVSEVDRKKERINKFIEKVENTFSSFEINDEKKMVSDIFEHLDSQKKSKDRVYDHWDKELVIRVNKDYVKDLEKYLNNSLDGIVGKIKNILKEWEIKKEKVRKKISNHPEIKKRIEEERVKREKRILEMRIKRELRNKTKKNEWSR
jgi:hypothetical protein